MSGNINVIVVPETDEYKFGTYQDNVIWINKTLGRPDLNGWDARYIAPFWLSGSNIGVDRVFEIINISEGENVYEIYLGNSFVVENWDKMHQHRRFEYHPLRSFNLIEIKSGLLLSYTFEK